MCNCKKKRETIVPQPEPQVITVPQNVDELLAMELEKHAQELANQIKEENQ